MWLNTPHAFQWNGDLPHFQLVQQSFPRPRVTDIPTAVDQALQAIADRIPDLQHKSVAVTAGSRGISEIGAITSALVSNLKERGAQPFIVPAMGSHGGGTAEGQRGMLAELGISEDSLGVPVISSLDTVELGQLPNGMPVYIDRHAAEADAIVIVNRIKPHTDFVGNYESGLAKMTAIGLGKLRGADTLHRYGVDGLANLMPAAARLICQQSPVIFGLASVENAYHEVAEIAAVPPEGIAGPQERDLLKLAYQLMPRFPFPEIDVLIVDEMGKNISGVGMDPKVIGRVKVHGVPDLADCSIRTIAVLRLTPEAHGNASGIGLADVTTQQLVSQIDFDATYLNCITSGITGIQRSFLPMVTPTDKVAIETALRVCGRSDIQEARVVRIKNTLSLSEMMISNALVENFPHATVSSAAFNLSFDQNGNILPFPTTLS
jgi:hypothetical protein